MAKHFIILRRKIRKSGISKIFIEKEVEIDLYYLNKASQLCNLIKDYFYKVVCEQGGGKLSLTLAIWIISALCFITINVSASNYILPSLQQSWGQVSKLSSSSQIPFPQIFSSS